MQYEHKVVYREWIPDKLGSVIGQGRVVMTDNKGERIEENVFRADRPTPDDCLRAERFLDEMAVEGWTLVNSHTVTRSQSIHIFRRPIT